MSFLGPLRVECDGAAIKVDTRKAIALLCYLAITGSKQRRDLLADLLWPKYDQTRAKASLRRTLSTLKIALGEGLLQVEKENISLNRDDDFYLDVEEFHNLLARCENHGHPISDVCLNCIPHLTEAIVLYRSDFLSGFSLQDSVNFDDWQFFQMEGLKAEATGALERLVLGHCNEGNFEESIGYTRRWLELDRRDEVAHRYLMESYSKSGKRAAALRQYEEYVRVLDEELGSSPEEDTVRLYEAIKENRVTSQDSSLGPPTISSERYLPPTQKKTNLPAQLTNFIGRKLEMEEIGGLMATTRLLTLTGSGGCGKTRLAQQVAADSIDDYPDGVWLVELADISDPDLVPQAVAEALGLREQSAGLPTDGEASSGGAEGHTLSEVLCGYLRSKKLLMVMDNCEHLIEASAALAHNLLHSCSDFHILATSREALGITGETAWRLPSLTRPDVENLPTGSGIVSALSQDESVGLFIDRAASAVPHFALTELNAPAIAQICYRLDGIPLAIELAAARVKALSVEGISDRLDESFRLLTGGSRTSLPRQQTLKAAMDWSYDLLSKEEGVLFKRLSAFAGGWTLSAAETICSGKGMEEYEIMDLTSRLVDKSLVTMDERDGEARYRFLETVRQYARDKLKDGGELEILCGRHLSWYLDLAEGAEPELRGPDQAIWMDRLELEHDNLRAALEWSESDEVEAETGMRLSGALWWFWFVRGYVSEGRGWLEGAIVKGGDSSTPARAQALCGAGAMAWAQGDLTGAGSRLEESVKIFRDLGDNHGITIALDLLGLMAWRQGDYDQATDRSQESLSLSRESGDKRGIAHSLRVLGLVAWRQGDYDRATELSQDSLALFRELEDGRGIALPLIILASVAHHQEDYGQAGELYKESLALLWELGEKWYSAQCLEGLAEIAAKEKQPKRAARLSGAAEALRQSIGLPLSSSELTEYDSSIESARTELGEEAFEKARAEGRSMSIEEAVDYALAETRRE